MNPFQRARNEAKVVRAKLVPGRSLEAIHAKQLLEAIEAQLNIAVEAVESTYPDLGGGSAVLQREQRFIYVTKEVPCWGDKFCGLVAHELGHWFLDAAKTPTKIAFIDALTGGSDSLAVMKVEAYGAREREELQANVFARELLLPRELARRLALEGAGPYKVASDLGIPLEFVQFQMLDALLLPQADSPASPLNSPSLDQLEAATTDARAANVVAGPGTGKTSTLVHRVKYLIEQKKANPAEILVLTFTNKAAFELVERLQSAGIDVATDVWAGTFHAFGLEFLRKYHQRFGLDSDVHVADLLTSMTMLAGGLSQLTLSYYLRVEDPYDWLAPVSEAITRLKEELVSPEAYREYIAKFRASDEELQRRREDVATLYAAHEEMLAQRKSIDFVDLIAKPAVALKDDRKPFKELADRFKYILVDEYQDVTQAMVELLRQLASKATSIWVVGDIRQAIHHWRGASLKSLMRFDSEFKAHAGGTAIQRYPLDTNRRSHQEILDLVHEVGRQHKLQPTLPLDSMTSAKGVCGQIPTVVTCDKREGVLAAVTENVLKLQKHGVSFGQQAVLCRYTSDVHAAAEILATNGIPVVFIGELSQRPEVKKLLCLMQLLVERQPKALIGLYEIADLRMPLADIEKLLSAASSDTDFQRGRWLNAQLSNLSTEGQQIARNLGKLLKSWNRSSNPWHFVCDMLLENRFCLPDSQDESIDAWVRRIALWQFAHAVRSGDGGMKEARLSRFLVRQRLRQRIGEGLIDRQLPPEAGILDGVRLSTVHGSKGLEFEAVHVAYVNAGSYGAQLPKWQPPENVLDIVPPEVLGSSQAEFELEAAVERNNLLYVAVSRAKRYLHLYQDTEFGDDNLAPQLQHFPRKFNSVSFKEVNSKAAQAVYLKSFEAPSVTQFDHIDSYTMCSLQYWYSQILGLKTEADVDVSMRARGAVMSALKAVASGDQVSPEMALMSTWTQQNLPTESEDFCLWRDANIAFSKGLVRIDSIINEGGKYAEPTSIVGGVTIQMPWGFLVSGPYVTEFAMMRFSRRRFQDISTLLKPIIPGLLLNGTKKLTLNYVLSDKVDDIPGAKRLEATKTFKAAVRMLAGDNSPVEGRHCARCGFATICPSAPHV